MDIRTKNKFLVYARYTIYGKFGYYVELQTVMKQQGVKACWQTQKRPHVDPGARKMQPSTLGYSQQKTACTGDQP